MRAVVELTMVVVATSLHTDRTVLDSTTQLCTMHHSLRYCLYILCVCVMHYNLINTPGMHAKATEDFSKSISFFHIYIQ